MRTIRLNEMAVIINRFTFGKTCFVKKYLIILSILCFYQLSNGQLLTNKFIATKADTVRGTYSEYRSWWDLQHYDLYVRPETYDGTVTGINKIKFKVLRSGQNKLQLDLQKPMQMDSVFFRDSKLPFERYENAYLITFPGIYTEGEEMTLEVYFHGKPKVATNPPWDGGLIWTKDDKGNPWISVACQGLGASVWWPCKDHGLDEPDAGATISINAPANLVAVSNGVLQQVFPGDNYNTHVWRVKSPINNYNITMNIGKYVKFEDTYKGVKGDLKMEYWFLEQHSETAKKHLMEEAKQMLKTFEYWFGAYPFYEDGYKLVETPFLGMEHQSAIAYGNKFMKGYLGTDLSGSGWGLKWDYILIHESGHEWFGNNITAKDVADMWIQEGFTTYSEVLYTETVYGKKAADEYAKGLRQNIANDKPIIGVYNVNREGSGDMYFKGVQIIHAYRQIVNDDVKFRNMLLEMNRRFYHQTTTTQAVEALMQEYTDVDLKGFFDTYLRTKQIPTLQYSIAKVEDAHEIKIWFTEVVGNFAIPINITINGKPYRITIGNRANPATIPVKTGKIDIKVDGNYYVYLKKLE